MRFTLLTIGISESVPRRRSVDTMKTAGLDTVSLPIAFRANADRSLMEDSTWNIRVNATGKQAAAAIARDHTFEVGASVEFDDRAPRISALEYLLGAVGAEIVNGLYDSARKKRVPIDHIEATVQGELANPLAFLGVVGEQGQARLRLIRVRVYISSLAEDAEIQLLWDQVIARSPLANTLRNAVDLDLSWKLVI